MHHKKTTVSLFSKVQKKIGWQVITTSCCVRKFLDCQCVRIKLTPVLSLASKLKNLCINHWCKDMILWYSCQMFILYKEFIIITSALFSSTNNKYLLSVISYSWRNDVFFKATPLKVVQWCKIKEVLYSSKFLLCLI